MYDVHTTLFKKSIIYWVKMTKSVFLTLISSFYSANNSLVIDAIIKNNIITVIPTFKVENKFELFKLIL